MAVITVTNTNDAGPGSLRAALAQADATLEADTVTFAPGLSGGTITLVFNSGPLAITQNVVAIDGDLNDDGTPDIIISGGEQLSLLRVAAAANAAIDGVTFTRGRADFEGTFLGPASGAIYNAGTLSITHSRFEANRAIGGQSANIGEQGYGAGTIVNAGVLSVATTVFSANAANGGQGADGRDGLPPGYGQYEGGTGGIGGAAAAGILNLAGGILNLPNTGASSTVFINNLAAGGVGGTGGDGSDALDGSTYHTGGGDGGRGGPASLGIVNFGTVTGYAFTTGSPAGYLGSGYGGAGGAGGENGYGTMDGSGATGGRGPIERVFLGYGTAGSDTFTGFFGDHTFFALGGADVIGVASNSVSTIYGGEGDDFIAGGLLDKLYGEAGADTLRGRAADGGVFDGGDGFNDTIMFDTAGTTGTYDLSLEFFTADLSTGRYYNFEHIVGSEFGETMIGNQYANKLEGRAGDDTLNGGLNADTLTGGTGNDTYVNPTGDSVIEAVGAAGGTRDLILSNVSYNIASAPNVEDITLTGSANINAIGGTANNRLTGNGGSNILNGGGANDFLAGLGGVDTLNGGQGNDVYVNPESIDIINEAAGIAGGLHDRIQTLNSFNLATVANVEDITLVGGANVNAIGDNLANILIGNNGSNAINGGGGADTITGGAGNDTLNGGAGADLFKFAVAGTGADRIDSFSTTQDRFDLSGGSFSAATVNGADTVLTHAGGTIRIAGITGLNLGQWNGLVEGGARQAPDHARPALFHDDAVPHIGYFSHFGQADFLYA